MLQPRFITFDCHGTLIRNPYPEWSRELWSGALSADGMEQFIKDFAAYRRDEALGHWKPFLEVISNAAERACRKHGIAFKRQDAERIYNDIRIGSRTPTCPPRWQGSPVPIRWWLSPMQ